MNSILLSIKPEYAFSIIEGSKRFEYRKRLAVKSINKIYIYCTAPISGVIACVDVIGIIDGSPTFVWENTKDYAGISRKKYREYFHGCNSAYAYKLGDVTVFDEPKHINEFGVKTIPQSFVYLNKVD